MRFRNTAHALVRKVYLLLLSLLGDLEVRSLGGVLILLRNKRSLPCATNDAALRNKGVLGCARRLMGHRKLQGKKCAPLV
jgi:hypothetical protein